MAGFSFWEECYDQSVKTYEFTKQAKKGIKELVSAESFTTDEAKTIYGYLENGVQLHSFRDYLRRYIYKRAGMEKPFMSVGDEEYMEIIIDSFRESRTPFSWEKNTMRPSQTAKSWLAADKVRRPTMFLLGFGLRMSPEDVSEFLTKVMKEGDFDPYRPLEVVCRYCFGANARFADALRLIGQYEAMPVPAEKQPLAALPPWPGSEEELMAYLRLLKESGEPEFRERQCKQAFDRMLDEARLQIAKIFNNDLDKTMRKAVWTKEDISLADVERVLCSGIPMQKHRNLERMTASTLRRQFETKRMSRQHLGQICRGEVTPTRYDLMTLCFFLTTQLEAELTPQESLEAFIRKANGVLSSCAMAPIYSANPYEAFLVLCLLCDDPMDTYAEIWEKSYRQDGAAGNGTVGKE